jgi:HEAT repeat protein
MTDVDNNAHVRERARHQAYSTDSLIAEMLEPDYDERPGGYALVALHVRGTPEVFARAQELCASADPRERRVGADILGQLGINPPAFLAESVAILLDMLACEQDPAVLNSVAVALGHRHEPRAIPALIAHAAHPDALVRCGVVFGLLAYDDDAAIATLIHLSSDADPDVRDWATFGLGTQIDTDTPAIREALLARTVDVDGTVRGEALVGLARRHDPRVVDLLLHELAGGVDGSRR